MILGLIGSGNIGGGLARLAVAAGLDVVLSNSRGPESLAGLVASLGPRARAATPAEAAAAGDIVIATIPLNAYRSLPAEALTGKIVVDTMNHYPERDGELDGLTTTSSALVQQHLKRSALVKAFNNIDFRRLELLARPSGAADRSGLPVYGDDADAKQAVTVLLDRLGYDAVDLGTLADSWRSEPGTAGYVRPYLPARPENASQEELGAWFFTNPGVPVPAAKVRELAAAQTTPATDARMSL
ncbi:MULTISPECIES: NADPH-dependent F420 reductase [Actinoplanes]|uniref:NADPH-dependent F420 reductase n=1 Tax=Actinoplanes TaxID=1865 RepID=UPI0005F2F0E0|nr:MULTISPECIES: NADPH-dependent F420 reductase [Actinoplanes]GLY00498.1 NADP oxidoreductase [Actinoplanes sp. NBRC 101535]